MALEKDILPLLDWLFPSIRGPGALVVFIAIAAGLAVISLFVGYLRMAIRLGPGEGFYAVAKAVATAVASDFPHTAPRRIWAMTRLAMQEAIRRRVLIAFGIFALIVLFAGWFLDRESDHPARLYLGVMLTAAQFMILVLAILLSTFSLPADIKSKTIYTVVTKPVRATEIVLGRIFGVIVVNTAILVLMGVISYVFVVRGLAHRHEIAVEDLESLSGEAGGRQGVTSRDAYHRHRVTVDAEGRGRTDFIMDHDHEVWAAGAGSEPKLIVGPPRGALVARVPIYGKLRFTDRTGRAGEGISVGKEWSYRKYIEGGSLAAAAWTFSGITPRAFPETLPVEMTLSVFRTYKGDIVSGILGTMTVKHPGTGLSSEPIPFTAREFTLYRHEIPRKLKAVQADGTLRDIDLFESLVDEEGNVEIWIQCSERAQYFGMAQADLYIRGGDAPFAWNFCKAYVGIWLQMVIVTCFGVVFSTFLSGPVALFATAVTLVVGLFRAFIISVATGEQVGGGPVESAIRMITQLNQTIELDLGKPIEWTIRGVDAVLMFFMWVAANVLPNYWTFNTSDFVAYGFNIDGNLLGQHCLIALAFVLVLTVYGYFFLKSREIAA
ncbi:MAG TPA: ABC transporter permease [Candidatus Anammoximicrobium sp.]|nr:ABC transporter permease [Candidatus Anammoximicrobium sp.]